MKSLLLVLFAVLAGCVANAPFRTGDGSACAQHLRGCGSFYEKHTGFDVGFVEYTERGNDFNPKQTEQLLNMIEWQVEPDGIALVVFVHGWKHNASTEDENVRSFVHALESIQSKGVVGKKKLIGIYVGWRGLSLHGLQSENITFWDRKATAEEVGRGGVTKFLLDLEHISKSNDKNFMMTIGHSFGGAIALSALHDVLLYKMLAAERGDPLVPFGDGVILLNPAIEANQGVLLKESSMRLGALEKALPSVMHVVSSRADLPTNTAFPVGQFLGVTVTWDQEVLSRSYRGHDYTLVERSLDQTTIGNYAAFATGYMVDRKRGNDKNDETQMQSKGKSEVVKSEAVETRKTTPLPETALRIEEDIFGEEWEFRSFCSPQYWNKERMPCYEHDPIDFISVPKSFITGHVDIFNNNVVALLSAVVDQSYWDRSDHKYVPQRCRGPDKGFSFAQCFASYLVIYSGKERMGLPVDFGPALKKEAD